MKPGIYDELRADIRNLRILIVSKADRVGWNGNPCWKSKLGMITEHKNTTLPGIMIHCCWMHGFSFLAVISHEIADVPAEDSSIITVTFERKLRKETGP